MTTREKTLFRVLRMGLLLVALAVLLWFVVEPLATCRPHGCL